MEKDHAKDQARIQLESIHDMVHALEALEDDIYDNDQEEELKRANVIEMIEEDPLEVSVRSDWYSLGDEEDFSKPAEYKILLCTGGPAVRVKGRLDEHQQPETAQLEYQDWGTPWTRYPLTEEDISALLTYAGCFYFGE